MPYHWRLLIANIAGILLITVLTRLLILDLGVDYRIGLNFFAGTGLLVPWAVGRVMPPPEDLARAMARARERPPVAELLLCPHVYRVRVTPEAVIAHLTAVLNRGSNGEPPFVQRTMPMFEERGLQFAPAGRSLRRHPLFPELRGRLLDIIAHRDRRDPVAVHLIVIAQPDEAGSLVYAASEACAAGYFLCLLWSMLLLAPAGALLRYDYVYLGGAALLAAFAMMYLTWWWIRRRNNVREEALFAFLEQALANLGCEPVTVPMPQPGESART